MRIIIPVAAPISYNPAFYMEKAFYQLGHNAEVVDQSRLYEIAPDEADLFVGVDSGGPLNIPENYRSKSMMWYIDSRRNHKPEIRTPDDDTSALELLKGGGVVFQAQYEDTQRVYNKFPAYKNTIRWLPLAADPKVWSDTPEVEEPEHIASFVGNCYDETRLGILGNLQNKGMLHWPGIEKAIMEDGAAVYRNSQAGVNIPSFYGTPECYDINMRVFEVMSCGRMVITNNLEHLRTIGFIPGFHGFVYNTLDEIPELITHIDHWKSMGENARSLIVSHHTYKHRAVTMLDVYRRVMAT